MGKEMRIFFTGVPGSRWSGVAQIIEEVAGLDTSDRTEEREYNHGEYSGHKGAYFGAGMEFPAKFGLVDKAHNGEGDKLIKSHEWSYMLDDIIKHFPEDAIILVHRESFESFKWWKKAGGFDISYPSYAAYKDDLTMMREIHNQNLAIESFCFKNNIGLVPFSQSWLQENFNASGEGIDFSNYHDVKVAYITWNG